MPATTAASNSGLLLASRKAVHRPAKPAMQNRTRETFPVTAMTNSLRSFSAFEKLSAPQSLSSKIICKIPLLSLKSTKIMPPLFLLFCTQPITVTCSPTLAVPSSVHLWDRFSPIIDSAMISSIPRVVSSTAPCPKTRVVAARV